MKPSFSFRSFSGSAVSLLLLAVFTCTKGPVSTNQHGGKELPKTPLVLSEYYFLGESHDTRFDFSGIDMKDQTSGYVVNDKSSAIFQITLSRSKQAAVQPIIDLAPHFSTFGDFDLEAIRMLSPKIFLIGNEATSQVIRWEPENDAPRLVFEAVRTELEKLNFNRTDGLEALCSIGNELLLVKEQKPVTLVEVDTHTGSVLRVSPLSVEPEDSDVTDCVFSDTILFLLNRNHGRILLLRQTSKGFSIFASWDFSSTLKDERFAYWTKDGNGVQQDAWGVAEALDIDERFVYVGLDNNGQSLKADPTETRPLLQVFRRPAI